MSLKLSILNWETEEEFSNLLKAIQWRQFEPSQIPDFMILGHSPGHQLVSRGDGLYH